MLRARSVAVAGTKDLATPAVYAMGTSRNAYTGRPMLVAVNGQVPGFTVPKLLGENPMFNLWTNAWGYTRVK